MPCPNCKSQFVEDVDEDFSDPKHHIEVYRCLACGTLFQWESTQTIIEEENQEEEINKELKKLLELKKEQERQLEEEEE